MKWASDIRSSEEVGMRTSDRFWSGPVCTMPDKPNDYDAQKIIVNSDAGSRGLSALRKVPLIQNLLCFFGLEVMEMQLERDYQMHLDYYNVNRGITKIRLYLKCKL